MDIHQGGHQQNRRTNKRRHGKKESTKKSKDQSTGRRSSISRNIPDNDNSTSNISTTATQILARTTSSKKQRRFKRQNHSIVNLSIHQLTKEETSILNKGLNFIPTPTIEHEAKIIQDFLLFERKLRLHHKLYQEKEEDEEDNQSEEEEDSPHKILRPSKGWKPDDAEMDPNIMRYKISVLNDLEAQLPMRRKPRFNTTRKERQALQQLKKNEDIVIKPADKGGAIVILNKEDYIKEGERQLRNKDHYRKIENPKELIKDFTKEVEDSLKSFLSKGFINEDLYKILYRANPRTSNLYLLPKIHKKNNPGRPIINSVGSLTETLSAFIDEILRKYSKLARSYVKDTSHFLQINNDVNINQGDLIATVDVTALYTNIPHQDGITRIIKYLRKHGATAKEIELCQEILPHILQKNYFEFNSQYYLQISGTAMGTRCAPNYAIIFMAELEEDYLNTCTLKPSLWKRYIDDIFMIWQHGLEELNIFLEQLNNFHPTIKFTEEHSNEGLPFLDTYTYLEDGTLKTRVYHKPTDNKQYLHYESCHPLQQKNSIPYSLLVRAKRICTEEDYFIKEGRMIIHKLRERKYPEPILERAVKKIELVSREHLMEPKQKIEDNRIRYILSYNPSNPDMKSIILQHTYLLSRMKRNPITQEKIQIVYRKSSNIRNLIVSGLVSRPKAPKFRCQPCRDTRRKTCISCDRITHTNTVTNNKNITHKIRGSFNCQSENCIYCLTCHCCHKKYVGETSQSVNNRLRGHESHIRNYKKHPHNPVANHFGMNLNNAQDYSIEILDQECDKNRRLRLEEAWIFILDSMTPSGLNAKW